MPRNKSKAGRPRPHIPEPVHRVPAEPVGSGLSFRSLPIASLRQIDKLCDHYESKVSGLYDHHSKAARYVHDMAQEIRLIIGGLLEDEEKQKKGTRHYDRIVKEWEAVFGRPYDWSGRYGLGIESGQVLTPKLLDLKFRELRTYVHRLEEDLHEARATMKEQRDADRLAMDETLFRERVRSMHLLKQLKENEEKQVKLQNQLSASGGTRAVNVHADYDNLDDYDGKYWRAQFVKADRARNEAEKKYRHLELQFQGNDDRSNDTIEDLKDTNARLRQKIEYLLSMLVGEERGKSEKG